MIKELNMDDPIEANIIYGALWEPILTLYKNAGLSIDSKVLEQDFNIDKRTKFKNVIVRDISKNQMVNAIECGILDSLPAVKEALKNSISIATLLGTLGGCVVFPRNNEVDKTESRDYNDFQRTANWNPADEKP